MHSISPVLRRLARRQPGAARDAEAWLDAAEAESLWGAVLDDAVPDLELGALLATLALVGESSDELLGLHRALASRCAKWAPDIARQAVAIPVYGLFEGDAAFATLLALFLRRFDVPVVLHGPLDSPAGPSAAVLLREFGVMPSTSLREAAQILEREHIAFLPVQLLSPALARLLSLRARLSCCNAAHLAAMAIDPGGMGAVRIALSAPGLFGDRIAPFLQCTEGEALLLAWPPGAVPGFGVRPRIARLNGGLEEVVFEAETADRGAAAAWPPAANLLAWIRSVVDRRAPAPAPLVNLAAACVHATGAAADFTQAKAIVALQSGRLAA